MNTSKKSTELIKLDNEIMDCFDSNDELAVITGGKNVIDAILDFLGIEVNGNNCSCNGNCGC